MSAMKKILFIENESSRSELIRAAFVKKDENATLQFVLSRSQALESMSSDRPDLIFFKSAREEVGSFVRQLALAAPHVLPILVSEQTDEQSVLQALKQGIIECVAADTAAIADFPAVADRVVARYEALFAVANQSIPDRTGSGVMPQDAGADIGRLKELLYRSASLAAVGSLVSGVVHEINNPLTGTLAYTELLAMRVSDESVKEDLKKILQSTERCKKIIDNMLTFSRHRAGAKSIGSINSIIEQTIDLRRYALRSDNIHIATDFGATSAILSDAQQIQQALLYVLLNAEEATASSDRTPRRISFITRENRNDRTVTLQIADTGAGFDPDVIPRIFDPFFTTKPGKCGLGLALAREIITKHGGMIQAENRDEGALITIVLPSGA